MRFSIFMPFVEALMVCVFLTPLVRWGGSRLGILDQPDGQRKTHTMPTPRCGGVAVYLSFLISILIFFAFVKKESLLPSTEYYRLWVVVIGGGIAMLMGLADDIWNIRARWKFLFQILAATIAYTGNLQIQTLSNPFGNGIDLGILSFPVTLLWFLVCMNAINFLDGLDGLAAGVSLLVCLTLFTVSFVYGNPIGMFISASLAGSILGFLIYNINPATIFMGDSGSMFIGFGIAALGLVSSNKAEAATALLIPIVALFLPLADLFSAALRRWSKRLPITIADGNHLHHRLLAKGLSPRRTVFYLYCASFVFCGLALTIVFSRGIVPFFVIVLVVGIFLITNQILKLFDVSEIRLRLIHGHETHAWRKKVASQITSRCQQIRNASSLSNAWKEATHAFELLDLRHAELHGKELGSLTPLVWQAKTTPLKQLPDSMSEEVPVAQWQVELPIRFDQGEKAFKFEVQGACSTKRLADTIHFLELIKADIIHHLNTSISHHG
ncbi:undecaprenyl/decaprenyl-phosphate alpha-N-acetylglucosaminyl 1-phosphate transferase [Verrucomicrobia bacterium]|nr:undecaprenyl/decaprenyl-phosphate alpha-N-acetylglucosaminyl 1-phosphate transferase [Verrucomicrobiota bacterium]